MLLKMSFEVVVKSLHVPIVVQPIWVRIGQLKCTSGIQFDKILFHLHKFKFFTCNFFIFCFFCNEFLSTKFYWISLIICIIFSYSFTKLAMIFFCSIVVWKHVRLRKAPCLRLLYCQLPVDHDFIIFIFSNEKFLPFKIPLKKFYVKRNFYFFLIYLSVISSMPSDKPI